VLKLWHSITVVPPGRIVSFCLASHVPLSAMPSDQSCFVMMQHTETSFCLMGRVTWLQPDSVHRGYWGVENPGSKPEACSCLVGFLTVLLQYDLVPLGFYTRRRLCKFLAIMVMVYAWFEVLTFLLKKINFFWDIPVSICDWLLRFRMMIETAAFSEMSVTN